MNRQAPKVSVIIPCYNVEKFVRQCVDSVVGQTLRDIEIILVNDGSTDSTPEILNEYAEKDDRVIVISKPNGGYGHTMNAGLSRASGKYIGIVESDDFAESDMFESMYKLAEEHGAQVVKTNYYRHEDNGSQDTVFPMLPDALCEQLIVPTEHFELFRTRPCIWSGLYLRSFLEESGIRFLESPGASFQDTSFIYKVFLCAKRVWLSRAGYLHYRTDNPASSVKQQSKIYCVCDEYAEMENFLISKIKSEKELLHKKRELNRLKFNTYIWNYNRLDDAPAGEFLKRFSQEFSLADKNGEIEWGMFNAREQLNLKCIVENPESFHKRRLPVENPIVSVVIPVYNSEQFLRQCLDSLLDQSMREIEIICVDDGSTDASLALLQSYADKEPRVKVCHQENSGAAVARNRGIAMSRGEYLSILDADDKFESRMLEKLLARARETGADITICKCDGFDNASGKTKPITWSVINELLPENDPFSFRDMPDSIFNFCQGWAWDKLYRAKFVKDNKLQFQNLKATNDMYFVFLSLVLAEKISVIPDVLVHQRVNISTSISKNRHNNCECFCEALKELKKSLVERGVFGEVERSFKNWVVMLSMWHFNTLSSHKDAFITLYSRLSVFLPEMGIEPNAPEGYYTAMNLRQYRQCCEIMSMTAAEYAHKRWQEAIAQSGSAKTAPKQASAPASESLSAKLRRKIHSGVRCLRDYGFVYTIRLLWGMLFKRG